MWTHTLEQNIAFIVIGAFTILLNSLEIYLIVRRRRMIKPYEQLLLNLAIADLFVGGVRLGTSFYDIHHSHESWVQKTIVFWLIRGLIIFSIYFSGMNILVISIDRLIAIKFPIRHKVWMSTRRVRIVAATTWTLTMTFTGIHESLAHTYRERWSKYHVETISVLSFGTVMIIVHILLIKYILKKPDIVLEEAETNLSQKRSWEKKVILTCTLFVGTYITCTWPDVLHY